MHVKNKAEAQSVNRKISHYGKYSELAFNNGRNTYKAIAPAKTIVTTIPTTSIFLDFMFNPPVDLN